MHHALAVPTKNDGSHPGGGGVRRLSIDAEPTRVDLVLSAATPIGLLIPPIVDILTRSSGFRAGPLAVHYQLSLPGSTALDPSIVESLMRPVTSNSELSDTEESLLAFVAWAVWGQH